MSLVKNLISFGIGVYTGVYLCQNYEIPRVDHPTEILEKFQKYLEDNKKK